MPSLFYRPMSPTPFGALASLKLRSLSALVLTGYVVVAAGLYPLGGAAERFGIPGEVMRALAAFGLVGAVVHALWFGLLLTRRGRAIACALAAVCAVLLLIALGSGAFARAGAALVGGIGLIVMAAAAWLAASGIDDLERRWHGLAAERRAAMAVNELAKRLHPPGAALHNLLLPSGDHLTEIDHVLVTPVGIVVIETKGYTGRIDFDSASGRWWRTKAGGEAEEIDSPMLQNAGHVRAVQAVLPEAPVYSLILLPNAELGAGVPAGVMALRDFRTEMFTWLDKRGHRNAPELSGLRRRLVAANRSTSANRRAHYDWLHRKRGHGPHPLLQQVKTTAAGVLFFSVPVLFPVLAILFAFNRTVGRLFG